MKLLEGRTGIIFGVANKRSIAWGIAQSLSDAGMRLAFTYQGERLRESVGELTSGLPGSTLHSCDVTVDGDIESVFEQVGREFDGKLDTVVHSVAFAIEHSMENRDATPARVREEWIAAGANLATETLQLVED